MSFFFNLHAQAQIPEKVFAPYADVNITNFDLIDAADQTGVDFFSLAFILDEGGCRPAWGGSIPLDQNHMLNEIQTIRSRGGEVIVSFGGSLGVELGTSCPDVLSLQSAYQSVIDKYELSYLDFDIEGEDILDSESIDMRNKAIAALQQGNENLRVSFTIPVLPSGLVLSGIALLENAIANGVRIDLVNIMTMNYGDANAPFPDGLMGQYSIDAIVSTIEQLDILGLTNTKLGVTPLIGQNQIESEIFYLTDAQDILDYVSGEERVGLLSMWSMARDNGSCAGHTIALPTCSGIEQLDYDFANLFSGLQLNGNQSPQITITSPESDSYFNAGDNILIEADAFDLDGTIENVEFIYNSTSLGHDNEYPYNVLWQNVPVGSYTLYAVARDNLGATKTASLNINVVSQDQCALPVWSATEYYRKRDKVSHIGRDWKAIRWTQGEEPGTTGAFVVWEDLGLCSQEIPQDNNDKPRGNSKKNR